VPVFPLAPLFRGAPATTARTDGRAVGRVHYLCRMELRGLGYACPVWPGDGVEAVGVPAAFARQPPVSLLYGPVASFVQAHYSGLSPSAT